jgi:transcriptional regulator with XRE-family HTH domain
MQDRQVGLVLRALRRRRGWRQRDLAAIVGVSDTTVSRAERGHLDTLALRTLRGLFAALDARLDGDVRWRGGDRDRLVDAAHASLGSAVVRIVALHGWSVHPEVTFTRYGERGSIDLLAVHAGAGAAAVIELKTELMARAAPSPGADPTPVRR